MRQQQGSYVPHLPCEQIRAKSLFGEIVSAFEGPGLRTCGRALRVCAGLPRHQPREPFGQDEDFGAEFLVRIRCGASWPLRRAGSSGRISGLKFSTASRAWETLPASATAYGRSRARGARGALPNQGVIVSDYQADAGDSSLAVQGENSLRSRTASARSPPFPRGRPSAGRRHPQARRA